MKQMHFVLYFKFLDKPTLNNLQFEKEVPFLLRPAFLRIVKVHPFQKLKPNKMKGLLNLPKNSPSLEKRIVVGVF
jgi:hypothetical protein